MIHVTKLLIVFTLILSATVAFGDDRTKDAAAKYESGMAHYRLGEWDAAIDDWQAGFRARPLPEFLYNIAQAYRLSKRPEKALQFYQSFLSMSPDTPNADEVRQHIIAIKGELAKQVPSVEQPKSDSSMSTTAPSPTKSRTPAVATAPPSASTATSAAAANTVTVSPIRRSKHAWVWGVVAGGVVLVGGAIVLGVLLGTASSESRVATVRF